jgi:DNA-binding MarR family transcriptional regulator
MISGMDERLPLSALLSQVWVAFTIEFDNEFEHLVPHRTTNHGSTGGSGYVPWLVSMTMWLKFMRFVPDDGTSVGELQQLTGLPDKAFRTWLTRMSRWWGYVIVLGSSVRPTAGGLKALAAWRPLTGIIEKRWQERCGRDVFDGLRKTMQLLVEKLDAGLPDYLPILGYELLSSKLPVPRPAQAVADDHDSVRYTLPALAAKVLLAFAVEFERDSGLSLAIAANVLRLTGADGVRVRDLPRLSGLSKEAIAMCMGRLEERDLAVIQPELPGSRVKLLVLTSRGQDARETYHLLVREIEKRWKTKFGSDDIEKLRELLEHLVGAPATELSPLFKGLEPYPEGWRASVPRRERLPHYPMVLHRGGFPDGS